MRHWTLLGEAAIPDTNDMLTLYRGKDDFFIKIMNQAGGAHSGGPDLMNSRKRRSIVETEQYYSNSEFQWRRRQFTLTFSYRLNRDQERGRDRGRSDDGGGEEDF